VLDPYAWSKAVSFLTASFVSVIPEPKRESASELRSCIHDIKRESRKIKWEIESDEEDICSCTQH
jgi:hypothetical protein